MIVLRALMKEHPATRGKLIVSYSPVSAPEAAATPP
jgi:hypothetical protein